MLGNSNNYTSPVREKYVAVDRAIPQPEPALVTNTTAWSLLDELDVSLQVLREQIEMMNNTLSGVLSPDFESGPCPGPRVSSSTLTSRIASQADFVDDLTRTIINIRERLSV